MQNNKLRLAIRSTAVAAMMGVTAHAGAFSFNAGDVEASIYGYAQLNASYDLGENLGPAGYGGFDLTDSDVEGTFKSYAEQSRIGFTAKNSAGVTTKIEGDFLGGDLRLRHAYGEYNGFLMGQNWSNYNSWVGNTALFDFNGLAGLAGRQLRNTQVRYTTGPLSFSAEEPSDATILGGSQVTKTPAFTARFEDSSGGLSYSFAAMAKQNTHDDGTSDDSAMGYGTFAALKMQVSDMISVQGAVNYTNGASSYMYLSGAEDGYLDNGDLETISGIGGAIGVGIGLGGGSSINVGVGMTEMDFDDAIDAGAITAAAASESRRNIIANYTWAPVDNVTMAVEVSNWQTESASGNDLDASRVMYVSRYSF